MSAIDVQEVTKNFGPQRAVDHVSFEVNKGEIFGLLGPNGAGKTTTIRIILDIFKPDSGKISVLGGPMTEQKKDRIGYMPEERGLYQDITLDRCLTYLASLKGMSATEAARRINPYLEKFDLAAHRHKKLKELSKGMQQKAQLIVTLVHEPELVIIDEPFSALDPINTQMVKDLLREQRDQGATIVMCTHQMHQVEELCDRLVLIDKGRPVLYGSLNDIRRQFSEKDVILRSEDEIPAIPGVARVVKQNGDYRLVLNHGVLPKDILRDLVGQNIAIDQFEIATPTLDEIFIKVVNGEGSGQ
jgi:ABC-2 type transport system ATP-binding protein